MDYPQFHPWYKHCHLLTWKPCIRHQTRCWSKNVECDEVGRWQKCRWGWKLSWNHEQRSSMPSSLEWSTDGIEPQLQRIKRIWKNNVSTTREVKIYRYIAYMGVMLSNRRWWWIMQHQKRHFAKPMRICKIRWVWDLGDL